jgi:hypothetical protein
MHRKPILLWIALAISIVMSATSFAAGDLTGKAVLMAAAQTGNADSVRALLDRGAEVRAEKIGASNGPVEEV